MKTRKHRIHIKRKAVVMIAVAIIVALIILIVGLVTGRNKTVSITGSTLTYYIDDEQYVFNNEPYICDNSAYLPVEDILSAYGYYCVLDAESGVMTITDDKSTTYMYVDKNILSTEKDTYTFNLPVMKRGGVVYMPSEMFSHFSKDELVFDGAFKFVERPYRDLMQDVYIDDTYRMGDDVEKYGNVYVVDNKAVIELLQQPLFSSINFLHILWIIFMLMMLKHLFPKEPFTMALLKSKKKKYIPVDNHSRLELLEFIQNQNIKAWKVMLIWLLGNSVIGLLHTLKILNNADLFMLTVFYFLCDYICILFYCPFQTHIMKNKCCVNCRIYDWGHFMMFTPMIFIPNFYTISLFLMSCVVLVHWELVYAKYPERFYSGSNKGLQCQNCNDKICQIKSNIQKR